MYTNRHLEKEIHDQLQGLGNDEVAVPALMTAQLIHKHRKCGAEDDLFTFCTFKHVRSSIGKHLARLVKVNQAADPQQTELYPLLQPRYIVLRDQVEQAVPRNLLTILERRQKARELIAEGAAKIEHGRQMDRETDALIAAGFLEAA